MGQGGNASLPRGFSPGRLLVEVDPSNAFPRAWLDQQEFHYGDIFEAYEHMFDDMAEILVPMPAESA